MNKKGILRRFYYENVRVCLSSRRKNCVISKKSCYFGITVLFYYSKWIIKEIDVEQYQMTYISLQYLQSHIEAADLGSRRRYATEIWCCYSGSSFIPRMNTPHTVLMGKVTNHNHRGSIKLCTQHGVKSQ